MKLSGRLLKREVAGESSYSGSNVKALVWPAAYRNGVMPLGDLIEVRSFPYNHLCDEQQHPRFDVERSKAILKRAIDLELEEETPFSENDVRLMAAELQIRPDAIERALREAAGGVLAPATQKRTTELRRWSILGLVLAAGGIAAVLAPDVLTETGLVAGYVFALLLSVASAKMLRAHERQQASVRLASDGVHYSTRAGPQTMKWTSVLRVRSTTPGTVSLEAPGQSIPIRLASFGDPDAILALIKLRVAFANLGTDDQ